MNISTQPIFEWTEFYEEFAYKILLFIRFLIDLSTLMSGFFTPMENYNRNTKIFEPISYMENIVRIVLV